MKLRISTHEGPGIDGVLHVADERGAAYGELPARFGSLPRALENWQELLNHLAQARPAARHAGTMHASLPVLRRTYQALFASAYGNRAVRVAQQAGPGARAALPLLMYQGASDHFLGHGESLELVDPAYELDFEPEICVITDRVPRGTGAADAHRNICLVTLCNDFTYRALIRAERGLGFGFIQGKPLTAMASVALTPDALGSAWRAGRLEALLRVELNREVFCEIPTGDMEFSFHELIAHAAATRPLAAGTVISSGTIAARGTPQAASIVERRALDAGRGHAPTGYLVRGDLVRLEIVGPGGASLFGPLENRVTEQEALHEPIV
jgi:fumarylacetoacetate (FAA) hydrolase